MDEVSLSRKPYQLPGIQHLLVEVSYLVTGLDLRYGDRVLDFGCGIGWTSRFLTACGCDVVGVDVSANGLKLANKLADRWKEAGILAAGNVEFRQYDGYRIDLPDASVDKVFVLDAFHHVPDQAATLREFARVLKPGGMLGMCEPGPNHSKHPDSQREMSMYTVVENDIVLEEIEANARAVGLGNMRVCLSPLLPVMIDFAAYKRFPLDRAAADQYLAATDARVKNYPVFFMQRTGVRRLDSRGTEGLSCRMQLVSPAKIVCRPGDTPEILLRVTNTGTATWHPSLGTPGSVSIGYQLPAPKGMTDHRAHLSDHEVAPGATLELTVHLSPIPAGKQTIEIDLVSEYVVWFKSLGCTPATVVVEARGR